MLNLPEFISSYPERYRQFKINDLLFVEYHCPIEEMKAGFWTPHNYFMYVLSGKKKWQSQNQEFTAEANDAVFIRKGAYLVHQFFEEEFCTLLIFVPDEFIKHVVQKHKIDCKHEWSTKSVDQVIPLHGNDVLLAYVQSVLSYFPKAVPPSQPLLEVKFEELIINLLAEPKNRQLACHIQNLCEENKLSIRDVMEANFPFNMNLNEFAKLSGRSLSTFHRDFKEIYNTTPGKWLTKQRAEYSKYLLEFEGKTVSQVAFDSGFKSSSHFIRVFRQRFGITPLQYKKLNQVSA
jgi:AraC-like DNA-binding protein